jgi:hypothetical protein
MKRGETIAMRSRGKPLNPFITGKPGLLSPRILPRCTFGLFARFIFGAVAGSERDDL